MSGDILYFEHLKGHRNVVLSDVVRGGFIGEIVEHKLRQRRWQILRRVVIVVGVGTGLRNVVPKHAGEHPRRACRRVGPNMEA